MDAVIRSGRLTSGRTVLAVPTTPGAASAMPPPVAVGVVAQAPVDVAPQRPVPDLDELRRTIEARVRSEHADRMEAERAEARQRAAQEGLAAGLAEGRATAARDAARQAAETRALVEGACAALSAAHDTAWRSFQSAVGEAAFAAVCRILGDQVRDRDAVLAMVDTVCRVHHIDTVVTARMHPRNADLLGGPGHTLELPSGVRVVLVSDPALAAGGCVIDTPVGSFDGSLETQLARLRAAMVDGTAA